jgi:cyclomaltodextrinase
MSESVIFDPRNEYFKSPFGAVTVGTAVRFCTRLPEGCESALFTGWYDFAARREERPMEYAGGLCRLTLNVSETPDLLWYSFVFIRRDGGRVYFGLDGLTADAESVRSFQLTVYDGSEKTPDWFGAGVTYQIFPDRFKRLAVPDASGMVGSRWVHENWDDGPAYVPERGEITNRDFFGGSFAGIESELDYLASLSVTTIYLNPIFESASNHRYDTADYEKPDPMLGTEEDFRRLCSEAEKRGIRIVLDGVFNHTGSNSRYFNALGFYPDIGAAQSCDSKYFPWYSFERWPDKYSCWWGVRTLPQVEETEKSYGDYIIYNKDSIVRRWLRAGASGWRLDVADELPDEFIAGLRAAAAAEKSDAVVIGEVWEDGSNKISYDRRRKYLLGAECHGLMNYPLRAAIIDFVRGGRAENFMEAMETIREHYPPPAFYSAMNILGTHDTPRILTVLGQSTDLGGTTRAFRAAWRLSPEERKTGARRLRLAAILLYAFPGSPAIFYGDEAGEEGCEDPFNRGTFPWGREDRSIRALYRNLGRARRENECLRRGDIKYIRAEGPLLVFSRSFGGKTCVAALNSGASPLPCHVAWREPLAEDAATLQQFMAENGGISLTLPSLDGVLLV